MKTGCTQTENRVSQFRYKNGETLRKHRHTISFSLKYCVLQTLPFQEAMFCSLKLNKLEMKAMNSCDLSGVS